MITVEEARNIVNNAIYPTINKQKLNLSDALGYVIAEDILSPINMPPFRQSAMDGYAINTHFNDEYLLINEIKAGDKLNPLLKKGEAVRIFTGSPVPDTNNNASADCMDSSRSSLKL